MSESVTLPSEWLALHIDILPSDLGELAPTTISADQNPVLVYLSTLARRSRRVMWDGLRIATEILTATSTLAFTPESFPWWQLRYAHVNAIRAILVETRSSSTGNRVLYAIKGVLKACWRLELMETDAYLRAVDVKLIKGERPGQAAGRMLSTGELSALFATCAGDDSPSGCRDATMLGLAAFAGLRRQEIADLELANWHPDTNTLHVLGKGNKVRSVPLTQGLGDALGDWLHLRGHWAGALFVPINKGRAIGCDQMTDQAIYEMMERRRVDAGVAAFSPHDLRRTFISNLLDAGCDLAVVQRLAGHADAQTTSGYDRRDERAKQSAVNRLHMSWVRRYHQPL